MFRRNTTHIRKPTRRRRNPVVIALVLFLLIIVCGCGGATYAYYNVNQPLSQFVHQVGRSSGEPNISQYDGSISGRSWNILLMGSDNDGKYSFPALLTQVMMVVHVDTVNNSVYLVSIPRDSWVNIPDRSQMHKLDQAFLLGATNGNSFDNGVRLARLTVEKDYGLTIDRYAWVGLAGFANVINTLGGIDIDVTHPVVDDNYPNDTGSGSNPNDPYALQRLSLAPGPQHLSGQEALNYVRSRHADLVGDIGRTQRQQQVLSALKKKLTVNSILGNLSQLFKDLKGQVYTDLSEQEMIAFANFGRTLPDTAIKRITLGPGQGSTNFGSYQNVYDPTLQANQSVIIPNCATIQPTINSIFGLGNGCNVNG